MTDYGYAIDPRPADLGGGVFPAGPSKIAQDAAYEDALAEASAWLATRPADEEPAFLDDEGPSDDLPTRITLPKS